MNHKDRPRPTFHHWCNMISFNQQTLVRLTTCQLTELTFVDLIFLLLAKLHPHRWLILIGGWSSYVVGSTIDLVISPSFNWLVVENIFYFSIQLGMSSSQVTFIFFRGVGQPPTSWCLELVLSRSGHPTWQSLLFAVWCVIFIRLASHVTWSNSFGLHSDLTCLYRFARPGLSDFPIRSPLLKFLHIDPLCERVPHMDLGHSGSKYPIPTKFPWFKTPFSN